MAKKTKKFAVTKVGRKKPTVTPYGDATPLYKIQKYTEFKLTYMENVHNVAFALARSGYYVKIVPESSSYRVEIYTDRI